MAYKFNDELEYNVGNGKIVLLYNNDVVGEESYTDLSSSQGIGNKIIELLEIFLLTLPDGFNNRGIFPSDRFEDTFDMYMRTKKRKIDSYVEKDKLEAQKAYDALNLFFGRDIVIEY